tara:strand:- start:2119 stop:2460 length:342 start_codon:yes stop_codon:yes gene_type:complete
MARRRGKKMKNKKSKKKYKKKSIPKAVREQCWLKHYGSEFESKCHVSWCDNYINVFNFHVGHDKPESKGGTLNLDNLFPICARCNLSMSNNYTISEWNNMFKERTQPKCCIIC